jgi:glycosyltransferase involved in cell wall biosynthesis
MLAPDGKIVILFVIGAFGVGGKERQLVELIHGLPKDRYVCHLFVKKHDAYYLEKIKERLESFHSLEREKFHVLDFLLYARLIHKIKPDIVCSWANVTSHFSLLAHIFSFTPYRIVNYSIQNAPMQLSGILKFERLMYSCYGCVVANSYAGLSAYNQRNKKGRHVLYNGFDMNRVPSCSQAEARNTLGWQQESFIVVMVASLSVLKDHKTLLKAAGECEQYTSNIQFFIVGDGTERDLLEKFSHERGLDSMVSFLGRRDDVELILRAADVSVLTSTAWFGEGISNSILESMACGTPVIASESPGTREVIIDAENGYIIPCGDHLGLVKKIVELQKEPDTMKCISLNARKSVEEKFSIKQLISNFCQIIEKYCD